MRASTAKGCTARVSGSAHSFEAHLKNLKKWDKPERGNPMRTRRNCDMTFLSQEQEDRIVDRIAAKRNPQGKSRAAIHRWWKGLSKNKRMSVAKAFVGRMNPWRGGRNPKRDGTQTRGEKRAVKYVEHLRTIMAASENARLEYQRLTGAVAKVGSEIHKPIGPRALKHAAKAHTEAWEAEHEMTKHSGQFTAPSVAAVVAEHPELKFITSQISDLDSTIEHFKSEIRDLPKDDLSEDEEARLQEEIAKLAHQKKKLRARLLEVAPATATNPRRRGSRGRGRIHPRSLRDIKQAGARCSQALRSLRSALRRVH